jgi:CheY-like chemotaxis protein
MFEHLSIANRSHGVFVGMKPVILLVDDNLIQTATRKAILEQAGSRVLVAADGPAALELLSRLPASEKVGLIVTDHLMPGMNGPELVGAIRREGFDTPILVLSGLPDAEAAYDKMGVIFRPKPFPPEELISLTQKLLGKPMRRTA